MGAAKAKGRELARRCGARTKAGGLCTKAAGWGTSHRGRGPCKLHGGTLPNVIAHHARAEAHEFVVGQLGYEMDIDPLEGALMAVRMAAGAKAYWEGRLALAYENDEEPKPVVLEGYRLAMQDVGRMSDVAAKAGVAERMVAITERMADQISLAFEEAAQAMKLDAATRMVGVAAFAKALGKLEQAEPLALTAGDS